jgi:predicted phosphodiesterase
MTTKVFIIILLSVVSITVFFNEFVIYYLVIGSFCKWPDRPVGGINCTKSMILSDTHLLGRKRGHPFDKLRREWQMKRSFATAVQIFHPSLVAILGDILDEGLIADAKEFEDYVCRFQQLFPFPSDDNHRMIIVVGNHDIGFHDRVVAYHTLRERFDERFNTSLVQEIKFNGLTFVNINSMAMEFDGCTLCRTAANEIDRLGKRLKMHSIRPVVLTHFPLFRSGDFHCNQSDSCESPQKFREGVDCLNRESTDVIVHILNPSLVLNGHTHSSCITKHSFFTEYTVASFNWRNRKDPSFLLMHLCPASDGRVLHSVSKCFLPNEMLVIMIYTVVGLLSFVVLVYFSCQRIRSCPSCTKSEKHE